MPTYETSSDRVRERAVAEWLSNRLGSEMIETSKFYPVDYFTYSKKHSRNMMVEIKTRRIQWGDHSTKFLSMEKAAAVVPYLQMGTGFALVIATQDKVGIYSLLHASAITQYEKGFSKNRQPDGSQGNEFVAFIPNDKFITFDIDENEIWK